MNQLKEIKIKKPNKLSAFFICLIIASALWLLHSLNTVYSEQFDIPIEFINYPHNKLMANEVPKSLKVTVKASGLKLLLISLNKPFALTILDFNDIKSDLNKNRFYLSSAGKQIQQGFKFKTEVKAVYPDTIAFITKAGTQKEVPVKLQLSVNYAQGFTGSSILVEPYTVMVNGEENDLKLIDTIYSEPVHFNQLKSSINEKVNLLNSNNNIVLSKANVDLKITVDKLVEKEITLNISVSNTEKNYKYALFPSKVKLKLTTALNNFQHLDTASFKAVVDIHQKRSNKVPVKLSLVPKDVHVLSYEPNEVEFLMIKKQ